MLVLTKQHMNMVIFQKHGKTIKVQWYYHLHLIPWLYRGNPKVLFSVRLSLFSLFKSVRWCRRRSAGETEDIFCTPPKGTWYHCLFVGTRKSSTYLNFLREPYCANSWWLKMIQQTCRWINQT